MSWEVTSMVGRGSIAREADYVAWRRGEEGGRTECFVEVLEDGTFTAIVIFSHGEIFSNLGEFETLAAAQKAAEEFAASKAAVDGVMP